MNHLLAGLLRMHDVRIVFLVVAEALVGSGLTMAVLLAHSPDRQRSRIMAPVFGAVMTLVSWLVFITAMAGTYPQLSLGVPSRWAIAALAISMLSATTAGLVHLRSRRSARNTLVAGSLLACGFSCMLFTGMTGLVRPFTLAYDLTGVMTVMTLGSALFGFALWELGNVERRHRWLLATTLVLATLTLLSFGSLAAILPFEGWMDAVGRPDDLTSSPIALVVVTEAVGVMLLGFFGSLVDNRVAARDRLDADRFRQLADSTLEGILIHRDGRILDANESLATLLGTRQAELQDTPLAGLVAPGSDTALWGAEHGSRSVETEILASTGVSLPVEILSRRIVYGGHSAVVTAVRDVRERRASEQRIRFLAHHDMLTELPNRVLLNESLELALQLSSSSQTPLAVLCLDLDGFKAVNDTFGHSAGDQLLCQVAARLRANLRESDFIARIGGDEFVVLQTTGSQPEQAAMLAQRIIEALTSSFSIDGQHVNVGTSIGIALHPLDGRTASVLLKKADLALYRAKDSGRGWFHFFEDGMDALLRKHREVEQDLRAALQNDEFVLHFQPLFDRNLGLVALEALVRWNHPLHGLVSPDQFIPVAEQSGLIVALGEWIMRTACTAAMAWSPDCRVAVNLSPVQFRRADVCRMISDILDETMLPPNRLEIEITEGVLISNTEAALQTLAALRGLGVRLVMDDFGTGYSSLSYLQHFSFDKLKIDRSFIQNLENDRGSRAIINAIISIGRSLDLEVTAEGVETREQMEFLCQQGCDELQGFFLSRPIPQTEVGDYAAAHACPGTGPLPISHAR